MRSFLLRGPHAALLVALLVASGAAAARDTGARAVDPASRVGSANAQPAPTPPPGALPRVQRKGPSSGPVGLDAAPGPPDIPVSPAVAGSVGAAALAGLFLLLYVYRRRLYIILWSVSTVLRGASLWLALEAPTEHLTGRVVLGLSQFVAICGALLLVVSADSYRGPVRVRARDFLGLLVLLMWFGLAPLVFGSRAVLVPGYLLSAGIVAMAGIGYLAILRVARLLGAGIVGVTLLLLAASEGWIAITASWAGAGYAVDLLQMITNALLYLLAALGAHLLVFEEMTYALRVANRQLAAARAELEQQVITDPLTGCHNRRFLDQVIGRELQRHSRYGTPLTLLFIDIDRFKSINDTLGHDTGDRVLQHVAAFLRSHVREADYLFRWGGDEFLAILSCTLDQAARKAADLKQAFLGDPATAGLPAGVGLSIGCAEAPPDASDILALVREADERMYRDKAGIG